MKNGLLIFIGLFASLAFSWAGIAIGAHLQLSGLTPYYDVSAGKPFPEAMTGVAARGMMVYEDLGCISCHTQQVRRPEFGSDIERGWGKRQSWARDYLFQARVQLGQLRVGPDLANVGERITSAADLYRLLYQGSDTMPAYPFLFTDTPPNAEKSPLAVAQDGDRQIVPTSRAEDLVAYLLSLKNPHDYPPEAADNVVPTGEEGAKE